MVTICSNHNRYVLHVLFIIVYLIIVFLSYSLQDFSRTSNTAGSDDCLPADKLFVWERVHLNLVYIALNYQHAFAY